MHNCRKTTWSDELEKNEPHPSATQQITNVRYQHTCLFLKMFPGVVDHVYLLHTFIHITFTSWAKYPHLGSHLYINAIHLSWLKQESMQKYNTLEKEIPCTPARGKYRVDHHNWYPFNSRFHLGVSHFQRQRTPWNEVVQIFFPNKIWPKNQTRLLRGGLLSGKVATGMCSPDRVPFPPLRFTNCPFFTWKLV